MCIRDRCSTLRRQSTDSDESCTETVTGSFGVIYTSNGDFGVGTIPSVNTINDLEYRILLLILTKLFRQIHQTHFEKLGFNF